MPIPVKSILDFFVDSSTTASETDIVVAARPDGRFFIGETDDAAGPGVFSRRYAADISVISNRTHANNAAIDEQQLGGAALRSGFEAFAWVEGAAGAKDIYAEVRSSTGSIITTRFPISGAAVGDQVRPEVIGLGDDRFAVVWIDDNTDRVTFAIHDIAGNLISGAAFVTTTPTSTSTFRQIDLAELPNGNFVIAYRPLFSGIADAVFRIFRNDGVAVSTEINVDGVLNSRGSPSVAVLADGRFVAMNGSATEARIFNVDGTASTGIFPVLSAGVLPQVTALPDGRFMAVAANSITGEVIARVMFADGTPDGAQFTVNAVATGTVGSVVAPSIATLADGRVVVSWTTNENGNLDNKAAIFDPRETGLNTSASSFNDDWVGTGFADIILAAGGNDLIRGGAGGDILRGEDGQDTLNGDAGDDVLDGGNDNDSLNGGDNNDMLYGGLGNDGLSGGNDDDQLFGGEGGDFLNGDNGNDILNGENGDDVFNGGAGNDTINPGSGIDNVNGGAENDVINFGATLTSVDSVNGGSGTDQVGITGNYVGGNALVFGPTTMTNVEVLGCLPGGTYDITLNDATVAAGATFTVFGGNLGAGENLTVLGSLETNGTIVTYGGLGIDNIVGGALSDGFYFGPSKWQAGDNVTGLGGANDQLALDGSYTVTIGATADVETLVLLPGPVGTPNSYSITISDAWMASGATKTVFGRQNIGGMGINGAAEVNGNFIIFGGFGSDNLTTGGGSDQIYGLEGNDFITGGLGIDTAAYQGLRASYSVVTGGGNVQIVDNDAVADGNDGTDTVVGIELARFSDQTIGITSPIILDLDGGGVETLSAAASNAAFDMDGDGIGDDTSWFGKGEGLLFLDRDGNGTLSNAGEMSFTGDVANARSDLEGLAAFDSNGDGQLSKLDARFKSFKIWQDRNGNGVVDAREIMTLKQAGVRSLSLTGTNVSGSTALGDTAIVNTGSFTRTNGRTGGLVDAVLTAFSSKVDGDQSGVFATDDPLTALRASLAADTGALEGEFDPRIALMRQDMASFGAGSTAVTDLDLWRNQGTAQVELFAA